MADFRRILIACIIAVLFTVFVFSINSAVNEGPKWEKYCPQDYKTIPIPAQKAIAAGNCTSLIVPEDEFQNCTGQRGTVDYRYDTNGCQVSSYCNTCNATFQDAQDHYHFIQFIIAAIFGLIAIIVGLFIPVKEDSVGESVSTGFLLGGLVTLFIGTALSFTTLYKWLRPGIILVELLLVIYIAYKKLKIGKK
jgi:hypothetical protein